MMLLLIVCDKQEAISDAIASERQAKQKIVDRPQIINVVLLLLIV
jgi:hypothetical protein